MGIEKYVKIPPVKINKKDYYGKWYIKQQSWNREVLIITVSNGKVDISRCFNKLPENGFDIKLTDDKILRFEVYKPLYQQWIEARINYN